MRACAVLIITANGKLRNAARAAAGFRASVISADSGLRALLLCASEPIDLVLIDESTPGMDPVRLREKLAGAFPDLPVAAVAGDLAGQMESLLGTAPRKCPAVAWFPEARTERGA